MIKKIEEALTAAKFLQAENLMLHKTMDLLFEKVEHTGKPIAGDFHGNYCVDLKTGCTKCKVVRLVLDFNKRG